MCERLSGPYVHFDTHARTHGSIGAGCDWFVHLQGGGANLQAAVAAPADAGGLEELLARHRDLLVAAAGAEDVTAVPAGKCTVRVAPPTSQESNYRDTSQL